MKKYKVILGILCTIILLNILETHNMQCLYAADDRCEGKYEYANSMTEDEIREYFVEYSVYDNYESTIRTEIEEELLYYFPNLYKWSWSVLEKKDNNYIVEVYVNNEIGEDKSAYIIQMLLKPDFSVKVLEDTMEINPKNRMCVYCTNSDYVYHGCRVSEYCATYYNEERDIYVEALIPLLSIEDELKWKEINCKIWEALEQWLNEETNYTEGKLVLDYEIKTLDNDLFSILLYGEYINEIGELKNAKMGITISMSSKNVLSKSVFDTKGEIEQFHNFYIEDNTLFFISEENGNHEAIECERIEFISYDIEQSEKHVYAQNGRWIGNCHYDLPCIYPEVSPKANKLINEQLKRDRGRFFNELAKRFEEIACELDEGIEYATEKDYATLMGAPGYHCYAMCEIIYNNENKFGVVYHYVFYLGEVKEKGKAVAVYDTNSGKVLEYQDWQSEVIEKMKVVYSKNER